MRIDYVNFHNLYSSIPLEDNPVLLKPISNRMIHPLYNDQAYIAEEFHLNDNHTCQRARLAFFKICSYKLSLVNAAFCISRQELTGNINGTLLNYTNPMAILKDIGFDQMQVAN